MKLLPCPMSLFVSKLYKGLASNNTFRNIKKRKTLLQFEWPKKWNFEIFPTAAQVKPFSYPCLFVLQCTLDINIFSGVLRCSE